MSSLPSSSQGPSPVRNHLSSGERDNSSHQHGTGFNKAALTSASVVVGLGHRRTTNSHLKEGSGMSRGLAAPAGSTTHQETAQNVLNTTKGAPHGGSLLPTVQTLMDSGSSLASVVQMIESHYLERIVMLERALEERSIGSIEAQALQTMYKKEKQRADTLKEEVDNLLLRYRQVRQENNGGGSGGGAGSASSPGSPLANSHSGSPMGAHRAPSMLRKHSSVLVPEMARLEESVTMNQSSTSIVPKVNFSFGNSVHHPGGVEEALSQSSTPSEGERKSGKFSLPRKGSLVGSDGGEPTPKSLAQQSTGNNFSFSMGSQSVFSPNSRKKIEVDVQSRNVASSDLTEWELRLFNEQLQKRLDSSSKELAQIRELLERGRQDRRMLQEQNSILHQTCLNAEDKLAQLTLAFEKERCDKLEIQDHWDSDKEFYNKRIAEFRAKIRESMMEGENHAQVLKRQLGDTKERFAKERAAFKEKEAALTLLVTAARRKAKDVEEGRVSEEIALIQAELEPLRQALAEMTTRAENAENELDPLKQQLHDLLAQAPQQHVSHQQKTAAEKRKAAAGIPSSYHASNHGKKQQKPAASVSKARSPSPAIVNANSNTLEINSMNHTQQESALKSSLKPSSQGSPLRRNNNNGYAGEDNVSGSNSNVGSPTRSATLPKIGPQSNRPSGAEPIPSVSMGTSFVGSGNETPGNEGQVATLLSPTHPSTFTANNTFDDTLDEESKRAIQRKISKLERRVMAGEGGGGGGTLGSMDGNSPSNTFGEGSFTASKPPLAAAKGSSSHGKGGMDKKRNATGKAAKGNRKGKTSSKSPVIDTKSNALFQAEREMKQELKQDIKERGFDPKQFLDRNGVPRSLSVPPKRSAEFENNSSASSQVHKINTSLDDLGIDDQNFASAMLKQLAAAKQTKNGRGVFR